MTDSMGISQIAGRTGVSAHTLRYYERAGLMIAVPRDPTGRRRYGEAHVRWVAFLRRLRDGGMGISRIREYAELTRGDGDPDGSRRRELLRAHRDAVRTRIARLTEHLEILDRKVAEGCAPNRTDPGEGSPE